MTSKPAVDLAAAEAALAALLRALGAPVESDPELRECPSRASRALAEELLDGYRSDPVEVLKDGVLATEPGLVVLTNIRYASMCPHHFLPSLGVAHIGYLPGSRVIGLGTMVRLIEIYAHRLILQETLGRQVCEALVEHLGARGAGIVLEAKHTCLAARGERQADAIAVTTSTAGVFATDPIEREAFLRAVGHGTRH